MSFSLPELPYAYDALAPHMSRETLEYHHDKHHLAYVNTARMRRYLTMRDNTITILTSGNG